MIKTFGNDAAENMDRVPWGPGRHNRGARHLPWFEKNMRCRIRASGRLENS